MKMYEKAPAKINLMLDVLRKRADGFHEVEMIMTMVDLADRLELSELKRDSIIISSQAGYIPLDEKNLAFQAARLIKDRYNVKSGVHIHLDKRIPVAAGLAGGSSDAAATLRGLNRLWRLGIPSQELQELGAELGSDVPFCVTGGTALATGRGRSSRRSRTRRSAGSFWPSLRSTSLLLRYTGACGLIRSPCILPHRVCSRRLKLATSGRSVPVLAMCWRM